MHRMHPQQPFSFSFLAAVGLRSNEHFTTTTFLNVVHSSFLRIFNCAVCQLIICIHCSKHFTFVSLNKISPLLFHVQLIDNFVVHCTLHCLFVRYNYHNGFVWCSNDACGRRASDWFAISSRHWTLSLIPSTIQTSTR